MMAMSALIVADISVLSTLGKVGGIAGISLGVVAIIFRQVIRQKIFPKLTDNKAFWLLFLIVVLTWSLGVMGLVVWAKTRTVDHFQEKYLWGAVKAKDGAEIQDALVTAFDGQGAPLAQEHTRAGGKFRIATHNADATITIKVTKSGYDDWDGYVNAEEPDLVITLTKNRVPISTKPAPSQPGKALRTPGTPAQPPSWEEIHTDVKKSYAVANVVLITQFGKPQCDDKLDGRYCRQWVHVTIQSPDETQKCSSVVAGYKLVKDKWRFDGVNTESDGCAN